MDFGKIDRVKSSTCAIRARTSILSHNDIIHGVSGGMAQQNKEVTDLGLENQEDAEQPVASEAPQTSQHFDVFQPFLDPNIFNGAFSFLPFDLRAEDMAPEHMQSFDDWLGQVGADGISMS